MPDVRRPGRVVRRTVRRRLPSWLTQRVSLQTVLVVGPLLVCSLLIGVGGAMALRPDALTPSRVAAVSPSPSRSPTPTISPPPTPPPQPTSTSATTPAPQPSTPKPSTPQPSTPPSVPSPRQPEDSGRIRCGLVCRGAIAPARLVPAD